MADVMMTTTATADAGDASRSARFARAVPLRCWLAGAWLAAVVLGAVLADLLPLQPFDGANPSDRLLPPSADHLLGTDGLGRDQLARLIVGARVSLTVSLTAVTVGMIVGGLLGTVVGYMRGRLETVVMAVVNVVLAFPSLVLLLVLLAFVGRNLTVIALTVGFLSIPIYARVARANALATSQREFVHAAATLGATRWRIILREIVPNVAVPLAAYAFVAMGSVIVIEGSLAFLGLSVQAPTPTWGQMIAASQAHIDTTLWPLVVPALTMFFTILSLNIIGDVLRSRTGDRK